MKTYRPKSAIVPLVLLAPIILSACGSPNFQYDIGQMVTVAEGSTVGDNYSDLISDVRLGTIQSLDISLTCPIESRNIFHADNEFNDADWGEDATELEVYGLGEPCGVSVFGGSLSPSRSQEQDTLDTVVEDTEQPISEITPFEYTMLPGDMLTGLYYNDDLLGEALRNSYASYNEFEMDVRRLNDITDPSDIDADQTIIFTLITDDYNNLK